MAEGAGCVTRTRRFGRFGKVVTGPDHLGACPVCGYAVMELSRGLEGQRYLGRVATINRAPHTILCANGHLVVGVSVSVDIHAPTPPLP